MSTFGTDFEKLKSLADATVNGDVITVQKLVELGVDANTGIQYSAIYFDGK